MNYLVILERRVVRGVGGGSYLMSRHVNLGLGIIAHGDQSHGTIYIQLNVHGKRERCARRSARMPLYLHAGVVREPTLC
jgi:hypothetical protein